MADIGREVEEIEIVPVPFPVKEPVIEPVIEPVLVPA